VITTDFARSLRNHYWVMRHGQSQANDEAIIVSSPAIGRISYGLTNTGREQARRSAQLLDCGADLRIYSSDFLRAQQTAGIVRDVLGTTCPVTVTPLLRERCFGDLDRQSAAAYQSVWDRDAVDPAHRDCGVESANAVAARSATLLASLERSYCGASLLLVAHGDVLQIMQTVFEHSSPASHRDIRHLEVAEIRRLN
jgi:probable phosphoglycerate mutase